MKSHFEILPDGQALIGGSATRVVLVIPPGVAERGATRYVESPSGCWVSTYSTGSHGYAQVGWGTAGKKNSDMTLAHRAAWVYHAGQQIPAGFTVDHTCKERRCVNPAHLRLLTNFENARRTSGRDWPLGECAHGHPNSELRQSGSKWVCATCQREWHRRHQERKRAA